MSEMPAAKVTWIDGRPWVRQMDHAMAMERMVAEIGKRDAEIIVTRAELKNANLELARHRPLVEAAKAWKAARDKWMRTPLDKHRESGIAEGEMRATQAELLDIIAALDAAGRGEES